MNKLLRYSFLLLLAFVSSVGFAQNTVTFTAGSDKGTQTNAGNAGDKVTKDGITIETTSGNSAFAAAQYRFSKGSVTTFSSTVGNITKVVFTCTVSGNDKYGPGCFASPSVGEYTFNDKTGTWTGNANSFTLSASTNQVRATKIEVTYTKSGDTPATTVEKPTISGSTPFTDKTTVTISIPTGTTVYYTTDGSTPDDQGDEYTAPFEITATTTVKAVAYNAEGTAHSDVASAEFVKQAALSLTGDGTAEKPYTVSDVLALNAAGQLPSTASFVNGTISKIGTLNSRYGEVSYYITTPNTKDTLYVNNGLYLNGDKFTSADQIKLNDVVTVNGNLEVNKSNLQFKYGNKITKLVRDGKDISEQVEEVSAANIAAFNAANNAAIVTLTLKDAQVTYSWTSNNGNTSIYLRDASGTTYIRNQKTDAVQLGYKTGDVLNGTIVLTRTDYNKAIQGIINDKTDASTVTVTTGETPVAKEIAYTDAKENESNLVVLKNVDIISDASAAKTRATERFYIGTGTDRLQVYNGFHIAGYTVAEASGVSVKGIITRYNDTYEIQPVENPSVTTGINNIEATDKDINAPIYNLAGQRVSKDYKGVVIQNGKKHINK